MRAHLRGTNFLHIDESGWQNHCIVNARGLAIALCVAAVVPIAAQDIPSLIENDHLRRALAATNALPHNAQYAYYRSQIAVNFSDQRAEALAQAQVAAAAEPNNAEYQCNLAQAAGARAQNAGNFERIKLLRTIHAGSDKGLQLNPKNLTCLSLMANFYEQAPGLLGGDKKKAVEFANRIVQVDAAEGHLMLASLAQDNKQVAEADAFRVKAAHSSGDTFNAHIQVGRMYLRDRKFTQAEGEARIALGQRSGNVAPYLLLAQALGGQEKWSAVDGVLADAKKAVPDNLAPYFNMARDMFLQNKDLPRSERYMREYLTNGTPELGTPRIAAAHWRLGNILEKDGRKQEALAELKESLRLDAKFEGAKKDYERLSKN